MPLDFPPVFHTATMVKILREQGSSQYAMELAELILKERPEHEEVRRLLEEMKEDARRAFERFKAGGRSNESPSIEAPFHLGRGSNEEEAVGEFQAPDLDAASEDPIVELAPARENPHLTLVDAGPSRLGPRERKVRRLESLLVQVQAWRKGVDASQA